MKINLIIGAGQLGSRHLQGMLKWNGLQEIYVVDPFEQSLKLASDRAKEINHNHKVIFVDSLNQVPEKIDLAIIATQSNVREQLIKNLYENHSVEYLILEKVLFQELDAFSRVEKILKDKKVWVNHPRRMFSYYQNLRERDFMSSKNKIFSVYGGNWGIACNALHFIDLFCFLAQSSLKHVETNWLDDEIISSKRSGYIEFTGVLKGELNNGDKFILSSKKGDLTSATLNVAHNQKQLVILEANSNQTSFYPNESESLIELNTFQLEYQSDLTKKICESVFELDELSLPSFSEAMNEHFHFLEACLSFVNKINKTESKILPIT